MASGISSIGGALAQGKVEEIMEEKYIANFKEIVIVEGRDDTARLSQIEGIHTIETHGFGISKAKWTEIENAYEKKGIIIFTDPDFAGNEIRRRIKERFPEAKEAFILKEKATKDSNIGIENASPKDLIEALEKAAKLSDRKADNNKLTSKDRDILEQGETISKEDLVRLNLVGTEKSKENRAIVGDVFGFGYANGKGILKKLNLYNITKEEIIKALEGKKR